MKPVFLSLGSEYQPILLREQARLLLSQPTASEVTRQMNDVLAVFFPELTERAYTLYGRDAIELGLRAVRIGQGDQVLTQAFSCQAVPRAIERAGAEAVFVDIDEQTMNPTIETLSAALKRAPRARAVIIQHTLGLPADTQGIRQWCTEHHLLFIEDLAQAFGGVDATGQHLGYTADMVILSFGKNKILDATSGGACLIRPEQVQDGKHLKQFSTFSDISLKFSKRLYPFVTAAIRNFYTSGVGKIVFIVARKTGILSSPVIEEKPIVQSCPVLAGAWALVQLTNLQKQLTHRKKIAALYIEGLSRHMLGTASQYARGSCLRFVMRVANPDALSNYCKQRQLFIFDRWYRHVVDSGSLGYPNSYVKGTCPNAEKLTQLVINLPTHEYVQKKDAAAIVQMLTHFGLE